MNALYQAALELQHFILSNGWRFCIIGGLAVVRWGDPRATQDVDVSLLTGFGREQEFVDRLLCQFAGRLTDARQFALENRVLLCRAGNGVSLDIALAGFPFEEQVINGASAYAFAPGVELITASAEDLILLKALANRDQDWADIQGIIERQPLDWQYIERELTALSDLCPGTEPLRRLGEIRRRSELPDPSAREKDDP
jgi:hypothetical protein